MTSAVVSESCLGRVTPGRLQSAFSRSWLTDLAAFALVVAVRVFLLPGAGLGWSRVRLGVVSGRRRGEGCEAE